MQTFLVTFRRVQTLINRPFAKSRSRNLGMTLIEIMIVVALLGTLMAILVNNLLAPQEAAQIDQARIQMGVIQQSLQMYRVHNSRYPTSEEGLQALLSNPGGSKKWRGPYIEEGKLADPWGEEFRYEAKGRNFSIISSGPDQTPDTDDDIRYPEESAEG